MSYEYNIAQNGRWGTLAMVACSLYAGSLTLAFLFTLTLFLAYVVEVWASRVGALFLILWTVLLLIAFAVRIWL